MIINILFPNLQLKGGVRENNKPPKRENFKSNLDFLLHLKNIDKQYVIYDLQS